MSRELSRQANVLLDLMMMHQDAALAKDEARRTRLLLLINEFEWAFPDSSAEVDAAYPSD